LDRHRPDRTGGIVYTPPEGEPLLRDLLTNWERFLNEADELDPLVKMCHSSFERPYLRIGDVVDAGLAKRQTAEW
jgi:Fic family protein